MLSKILSKPANSVFRIARVSLSHEANFCRTIDASRTEYRLDVTARKVCPAKEDLTFGRTFSDHMLVIDWNKHTGWATPVISEFTNFSMSPASLSLHYGIQCFEGMKAYKDKHGNVRLFRPDKNMTRFADSMERLALPPLDKEGFLECLKQLVLADSHWIPDQDGYSLYIRPTAIGTSPYLGVQAPSHAKVFCILSPVGPYYKSGFAPVKLFADSENVRAWPGGVGNVKVGGNYAPTISLSRDVAAKYGCQQILWLFGENHEITEVGAMNIFFAIKSKNDPKEVELITAPLTRHDVLPGVTRDTILALARGWGQGYAYGSECSIKMNKPDPITQNIKVSERFLTMGELLQAKREDRLVEIFGCGTAAIVSPVSTIMYKGEEIQVPTKNKAGPLTTKFWQSIVDIQYGRVHDHPWSVLVSDTK
jgi:branched-chain amino acid aminotransferase